MSSAINNSILTTGSSSGSSAGGDGPRATSRMKTSTKLSKSATLNQLMTNYYDAERLTTYVPMKTVEYACLITSSYLLLTIIVFVFSWILLYSFNPFFVQLVCNDDDIYPRVGAPPDPIKCFMYSVIFAVVFAIVTWIVTRDWKSIVFNG